MKAQTVITSITEIETRLDGIQAAVFDLDDTLYSEKEYVKSGYACIAVAFPQIEDMQNKLWQSFLRGGKAIDEVLSLEGALTEENKLECLRLYRFQTPDIHLYKGVEELLTRLRKAGLKIGIITDGRSEGQRAKIAALGLENLVDEIIVTDELGGVEFRKPNPLAFELMQKKLGVPFEKMIYVGDNEKKDFVAPNRLGMKTCLFANPDGLYTQSTQNAQNTQSGEKEQNIMSETSENKGIEKETVVSSAATEDKYGTRAVQNELLAMMKDIHAFFESKGIRYALCSGSALGAVRHNGFIPWDDDMDILVDRENYQRILEVFGECDGYVLRRDLWIYRIQKKGREKKEGERYLPTVDIFVLDNAPDGKWARKWQLLRLKMLQGMMKKDVDYQKFSFAYKACLFCTHLLGKLFTYNYKFKRYEKISRKANKKDTKYTACFNDLFKYISLRYEKDLLQSLVLHPFEDTQFYIPEKYDMYLTTIYGDYMTPPKESERVARHL